ncbi:MAG: hypothetical protein MUC68_06955 [Burkholderiaceae bacterium]|nr:hypothetical protein [Burkholderiaceae bacterium]
MAQINLGNFGGLVAQPAAQPRLPAAAPNALAEGIGRVGEIVGRVAMNELQRQQQMQDQRTREQLTLEREQRRAQAARIHAETVNTLAGLSDTLSAESADGRVDKNDLLPQWAERSQKVIDEAIGRMPQEMQDAGLTLLIGAQGRGADQMRTIKATRDRQDTAAGVRSYLAESERYAARGGREADEAIRNVSSFLSSPVAAAAGLDGQETARRFAESVRFRQAADMVQANPAGALKTLRDKDRFSELDPDKRASLIAHADAALLRAQERARIEAERIARPEYGDQVLSRLKGSPYESAVREMIRTGPQNVAAATLPIPQQRQQLDALMARANTEGTTPALNAEIARRQKVLDASAKDAKDDPLGAALERGVIAAVAPLNVADLSSLPAALSQRQEAARTAQLWSGQPVSPLRPQEAEQLSQSLAALPPDQKATALASIGAALNDRDQITALARQIDAKDKQLATAMMYATTKTSAGRYVSEIILRGQQAQRDGKVKEDRSRETGWRAAIATEIGNAYPNEELRGRMVDAAYAVQVGLAAEGDPDVSRAVRLATGGVMTQADDSKVPLPYGWTERELRDGLRTYPATKLPAQMRAGPATLTREQLIEQLPDALLVHAGQGRYAIRAGSGFITDAGGGRIVLDFSGSGR